MVEYNPFNHQHVDDAFAIYEQLRNEAPVYHNEELDFYALSRYDDVVNGHLDVETFSSGKGVTIEGIDAGSPFLIVKDPPEHSWHRKIVSRVFTPRRISGLEPFIRARTSELLDEAQEKGRFDLVEDFSFRLPLDVISELIGIPVEHRDTVHELSEQLAHRDGTEVAPEAAFEASAKLVELLTGLVRERRKNPGDDVISLLINTEVVNDDGESWQLPDDEIGYRFLELSFAGHETVAKLIPNGAIALHRWPDQRRELINDPALMPNAIEEMLRWDPPSHYQGRWTLRPIELHGTVIPEDRRVILITGSAVRDERKYPDPATYDLHRDIDRHVSFGFGRHLCLGAALARLEMRIAFEELLGRFPDYEVDEANAQRAYSGNVRGLATLPFEAKAAAGV
jgi:cytochrome P450